MNSLSANQARQSLSYLVFAVVAVASFIFWGVELRISLSSHDTRETELIDAHQQRQLELKAESIRDLTQEIYQGARTISLLPAVREARGGNRRSPREDPVASGRISADTHRLLKQMYSNLRAYVQLSEFYFVVDGFDPARGDVPYFMYDDEISGYAGRSDKNAPGGLSDNDEAYEYLEIRRQLDWFRANAPVFRYEKELNAIPARISGLVATCDHSQEEAGGEIARNNAGFVISVPVFDLPSGRLKGVVSVVVRANVFEARLVGVPFLPVTGADREKMREEGWGMPPPSAFVLIENDGATEIADRRNQTVLTALHPDRSGAMSGRWARQDVQLPVSGRWSLRHYLSDPEIDRLAASIRESKRLSIAGRLLLVIVLTSFLFWGFWLMRASRRELIKMAHYDLLTDLPNRRLFFDRMEDGMRRADRHGRKMGLFFVDLAGLNAINDRHGHHGGDLLLVKMVKRLHDQLRLTDGLFLGNGDRGHANELRSGAPPHFTLSRLGGDEFTILCEDLQFSDDLGVVAERIVACVKEPFQLGDETVEITLNIGATLYPDDARDPERLLMSADSAMHECKQTHARYVLYNEEMRQRAERQHVLTLELISAIQRRQFELYYQPKAMLLNGEVVSMEALIRWRHPTLGLVSPGEFIPIMERNGAIVELGEWIVEQACRDLHRLTEAGFPEVRLSVNVSVRQLKRGNFHDYLKKTLHAFAIEPRRLILEITETMVIEDLKKGREAMLALERLGVGLSIDDFGAGYSSLTYLQHLPLSSLKIDKSLIDGMIDERAIHVVESVIRLAQGLSLKTIAEGVETEAQRELIGRLGCDMIQGYLLSRPLPLEDIIAWLRERHRGKTDDAIRGSACSTPENGPAPPP